MPNSVTMHPFIEQFCQWIKDTKSDSTSYSYDIWILRFWLYIKKLGMEQKFPDLPRGVFENYVQMLSKNRKPRTVKTYFAVVSTLYDYLIRMELVIKNPTVGIQLPRAKQPLPRILTEVQINRVIEIPERQWLGSDCPRKRYNGLHDFALLQVLYSTACRIHEAINLTFANYVHRPADEPGDAPMVGLQITGKGGKERIVPLTTVAVGALGDWIRKRSGTSEFIFTDFNGFHPLTTNFLDRQQYYRRVYKRVRRYLDQAGITGHGAFHRFRHTCATQLYQRGVSLLIIKDLLGHENISTTTKYVNISAKEVMMECLANHPHTVSRNEQFARKTCYRPYNDRENTPQNEVNGWIQGNLFDGL